MFLLPQPHLIHRWKTNTGACHRGSPFTLVDPISLLLSLPIFLLLHALVQMRNIRGRPPSRTPSHLRIEGINLVFTWRVAGIPGFNANRTNLLSWSLVSSASGSPSLRQVKCTVWGEAIKTRPMLAFTSSTRTFEEYLSSVYIYIYIVGEVGDRWRKVRLVLGRSFLGDRCARLAEECRVSAGRINTR